jgi:HlyD family secretion protein
MAEGESAPSKTQAPGGGGVPRGTKIFRKAVLDRLSSPEQLHLLMRVTDAKGWLALLACGLILAMGVAWGVLGKVPTKVQASGILIPIGGLADVVAMGDGQLTSLQVQSGDQVRKDQIIARIAQPELVGQIEALRKQARELQLGLEKSKQQGSEDVRLRSQASAQERATLRSNMDATVQRKRELEERLASQEDLLQKGLVTRESVQATRQQLRAAEASMKGMQADLQKVAVEHFSVQRANEGAVRADSLRVTDIERQIKLLEDRLADSTAVLSPHAGRVVEVRATVGDVIRSGMPIASLERTGEGGGLEALLYVDSRQGKAVHPGMAVEVAPTVVRRERYGAMVAKVLAVEDFPSTRSGMMRVLHNDQLVEALLAETAGAPIAVRATLERDPTTPTTYRWTSGRGPDLQLSSGTRFTAYVVTRSQRPLALVFPILDTDN